MKKPLLLKELCWKAQVRRNAGGPNMEQHNYTRRKDIFAKPREKVQLRKVDVHISQDVLTDGIKTKHTDQ